MKRNKTKKQSNNRTSENRPMSNRQKQKTVLKADNRANQPQKTLKNDNIVAVNPEKSTSHTYHAQQTAGLHLRRVHKKHQHDHFREDLERAISHFESSKESYANCLLYPEVCMARVPFICPVPTALARGTAIYTFTPDTSAGDTFAWSFVPEAICCGVLPSGSWRHEPFYYGSNPSNTDVLNAPTAMTREQLFPNIQFASIDTMRVVGSSITVTQTQRLVDRAGYGLQSRVYGLMGGSAGGPTSISKNAIINSTYKDEANYSSMDGDDHLRMVYAPADFSDLHMRRQAGADDNDQETFPVIQGFMTGYGSSVVSVTMEFNIVIEYVPRPILYQMVERKPVKVSPEMLAKGENLVSRTDTGVDPQRLNQIQRLAGVDASDLRAFARTIAPGAERNQFMSTLNMFGTTTMRLQPLITDILSGGSSLQLGPKTMFPTNIKEVLQDPNVTNAENDSRPWREPESSRLKKAEYQDHIMDSSKSRNGR